MKQKRLYHIASIGFVDQHLDRIDNIELCLKLMWENYNKEQDPYKRFQMLKDIIMIQPYLSTYYETTKLVMQQQEKQLSTTNEISNNNSLKGQKVLDNLNHLSAKGNEDRDDEFIKEYDPNRKF